MALACHGSSKNPIWYKVVSAWLSEKYPELSPGENTPHSIEIGNAPVLENISEILRVTFDYMLSFNRQAINVRRKLQARNYVLKTLDWG